ncbi:MAG TPA: Os1348 family NHLP clan protein [Ktedonobacteraceae bacterium]|nr:Os1348 family NHLP clan protein [Ktedonobacteraceae bacterium]
MMTWQTINHILGLAAVDQAFWQELQNNPLEAIRQRGFELTEQEQVVLGKVVASDLAEFSLIVLERLAPNYLREETKQ